MPTRNSVKNKSEGEYTKVEALAQLGLEDTEEGFARLLKIIDAAGLMPPPKAEPGDKVYVRSVNTKHGPQYYFDKRMIAELRVVKEYNERRKEGESLAGIELPHGKRRLIDPTDYNKKANLT